jgi:hypothetical protein
MRTITDAVGDGPLQVRSFCDEDGCPTSWKQRGPVELADSDTVEAMDGHREEIDTNPRGSSEPLGALVLFDGDESPSMQAANDNAATGKTARSWRAMERARAGTLMLTSMENLAAQVVLIRVRDLYLLSDLPMSAIPSRLNRSTQHMR